MGEQTEGALSRCCVLRVSCHSFSSIFCQQLLQSPQYPVKMYSSLLQQMLQRMICIAFAMNRSTTMCNSSGWPWERYTTLTKGVGKGRSAEMRNKTRSTLVDGREQRHILIPVFYYKPHLLLMKLTLIDSHSSGSVALRIVWSPLAQYLRSLSYSVVIRRLSLHTMSIFVHHSFGTCIQALSIGSILWLSAPRDQPSFIPL